MLKAAFAGAALYPPACKGVNHWSLILSFKEAFLSYALPL